FLSLGQAPVPYLLQANCAGKISVEQLVLGSATATQLSADVGLGNGQVTISNMRASVLGGHLTGGWKADFDARPPAYSGEGSIDSALLSDVADLLHDDWINGDGWGSAKYDFETAGWNLKDVLANAGLRADFRIENGVFPLVVLAEGAAPLRANQFTGNLVL